MPILRTADGRYFDVPENVLLDYKLHNNQLPAYITNPNDWIDAYRENESNSKGAEPKNNARNDVTYNAS